MCVGKPDDNCVTHTFEKEYESAKDGCVGRKKQRHPILDPIFARRLLKGEVANRKEVRRLKQSGSVGVSFGATPKWQTGFPFWFPV